MRKLKFSFSRSALIQIYFSYLLPVLEYASTVWDGCSTQNSDILDKIQNEAARIVTGLTRSISLDNLYRKCGWLSLAERRRQKKLNFMFKVHHGQVPTYISDLISPLVRDISNYPLRNMNNYSAPFTGTEFFKKSSIPSSISLWNAADNSLKESNTLQSFKHHQKRSSTFNLKIPSYYLFGNRRLAVLHARMRNNCSNLNFDLFNNFLRLDPLYTCLVEPENAEHYFFRYNEYNNQRLVLFNSLRNFHPKALRHDVLLCGNPNLSVEDNRFF